MSKISIIGIVGESVFLSMDSLPKGGETVHAHDMFTELGGKGFNQAIAAARFGAEVSFFTAVGKDGYKQKVIDFCNAEKITPFIVEKNGRTAYAVIQTERSGENVVTVYNGAKLEREDLHFFEEEIKSSEFLLVTNEVPYELLKDAIALASKHSVKVIFNPAPYRETEEDIKEKVYLFTPNEHETVGLEGRQNVVITMGKEGCLIKSLQEKIPPTEDKPLDTTGAGDTFNGVLTAMLAQGKELINAVDIANRAAGKCVTKRGAATAVPYLENI